MKDDQPILPLRAIVPGTVCWRPKEDINAYELALALPVLLLTDQHIRSQMTMELPPHVLRHFSYQMKAAHT